MVEPLKRRIKILIGIPIHKPDDRFLEVLPKFIKSCSKDYDTQVISVKNCSLVDAQNKIADYFMHETDYDYLLIMEDDHWGHTKQMLKSLISKNVEVCAINYYSRHFPFVECLMRELSWKKDVIEKYAGLHYTSGFHKCELAGFAMMLLKRSVFTKLSKPYFRVNKDSKGGYATDIDFSVRLKEAGISVWGCFDYILAHRDITKENRLSKFLEGLKIFREKEIAMMLNRRKLKCQ
jgi:hypothetical protein